ncbi:uncharacterized protein UTRI_02606 [Ustilago trichophora]|uniref:Uncharacterized protein n=1 Tax=Ustilago trichophora TaxID=86804 RepID=A0A5C3ERT3_9BASI|nr:uncharacterized protein UTRI_02606 [Ustilago trichophora]
MPVLTTLFLSFSLSLSNPLLLFLAQTLSFVTFVIALPSRSRASSPRFDAASLTRTCLATCVLCIVRGCRAIDFPPFHHLQQMQQQQQQVYFMSTSPHQQEMRKGGLDGLAGLKNWLNLRLSKPFALFIMLTMYFQIGRHCWFASSRAEAKRVFG